MGYVLNILYSIGTTGMLHLKISTYMHDILFMYHTNMLKIHFEIILNKFDADICTSKRVFPNIRHIIRNK
jgi:hypothetical protein